MSEERRVTRHLLASEPSEHWTSTAVAAPIGRRATEGRDELKPRRPLEGTEEVDQSGESAGVDPRTLKPDQLRELGHEPMTPLKVIRAKCLDCCCGSAHEVRYCLITACPLWPYRMGRNPMRPASQAQRDAWRRTGERLQQLVDK
jgi:hypothetical protein